MASRSHAEAVLNRARAELARGPMTDDERFAFDCARAWEMLTFEQARYPERFAEQLPLALTEVRGRA